MCLVTGILKLRWRKVSSNCVQFFRREPSNLIEQQVRATPPLPLNFTNRHLPYTMGRLPSYSTHHVQPPSTLIPQVLRREPENNSSRPLPPSPSLSPRTHFHLNHYLLSGPPCQLQAHVASLMPRIIFCYYMFGVVVNRACDAFH